MQASCSGCRPQQRHGRCSRDAPQHLQVDAASRTPASLSSISRPTQIAQQGGGSSGGAGSSGRRHVGVVRALDDGGGSVLQAAVGAAPIAAALGFGGWKFWCYSQLEYITAAMLSRYVPRGEPGPRVIQLQGGTRELYYYPKSVVQVTIVGDKVNKSLVEQAGMQAAVPTVGRAQSVANLGFQADASVDAVVSLCAFADASDVQRAALLQEALRVLKPGRPLVFIERVPGGFPLRGVPTFPQALGEAFLQKLQGRKDAFSDVQWDVALEGQDPHAVGIAVKSERYRPPPPPPKQQQAAKAAAAAVASAAAAAPEAGSPAGGAGGAQPQPARKEAPAKPKKGFK